MNDAVPFTVTLPLSSELNFAVAAGATVTCPSTTKWVAFNTTLSLLALLPTTKSPFTVTYEAVIALPVSLLSMIVKSPVTVKLSNGEYPSSASNVRSPSNAVILEILPALKQAKAYKNRRNLFRGFF